MTVEAGDEASYNEWEDVNGKNYGTRKPGDAKHGIIRTIDSKYGWIREATYCENKPHGLWFYWSNNPTIAFVAVIYNHGEQKAWIQWRDDWKEKYLWGNKEMILENNGLSIFKP